MLQLTFDELCERAALVFEGHVIGVSVYREDDGGHIWTRVRFRIDEPIKGPAIGSFLDLDFLGGTADGLTLEVDDMNVPQAHEHGVYFVESLDERLINPLLGWSQGHYRIESDADGTPRVTTPSRRPLLTIDRQFPPPGRGLAGETALGLHAAARGSPLREALSADDFKEAVRRVLAAARPGPRSDD